MENKEIERKYFLDNIPDNVMIEKIMDIEQIYLYRDENTTVRIRKIQMNNEIEYIYTVKTNGNIETKGKLANKYEIESNISKENYEKLSLKKISNIINKKRIVIPIENNLKVEIDIYKDYLKGFLVAEVEFPNQKEANKFIKPKWIGKEVGFKEFSNGKLSEMTKEEFKSKVSEKIIRKNEKIIKKLLACIK